jgi:hypothetical protein
MESLIGLLPFAIIALACPLMMIFMMRGMHGGHGEQGGHVGHGAPDAAGQPDAPDDATAARLQAMEEQVTALRRELAERDAEKLGVGRDGRL